MTTDGKALMDGKEIYVACQVSYLSEYNKAHDIPNFLISVLIEVSRIQSWPLRVSRRIARVG